MGVCMAQVITSGYRGLTVMVDLALDRLLVPVAIALALAGACLIGVQLLDVVAPEMPHRL